MWSMSEIQSLAGSDAKTTDGQSGILGSFSSIFFRIQIEENVEEP